MLLLEKQSLMTIWGPALILVISKNSVIMNHVIKRSRFSMFLVT